MKRNFPPGQHGPKGKGRQSNYGLQLREKQKAKRLYGLNEAQFANYFKKAEQMAGDTSENLGRLLETRFDNVIYRLGIGDSRAQARQLVGHGHFQVNGRSVDIPSFRVKSGDQITVKSVRMSSPYFVERLKRIEKHDVPAWLSLDKTALSATVSALPAIEDLKQSFQSQLIVEFYSR